MNLIEISIDKTIFIIMKSNAYKVLLYKIFKQWTLCIDKLQEAITLKQNR